MKKHAKAAATSTSSQPASAATVNPRELKTILAPIDFSEPSRKAAAYAGAVARQFNAKVVLLYVMEPVVAPEYSAYALLTSDVKVRNEMRKKLEQAAPDMGLDKAVLGGVVVRQGTPFHEIVQESSDGKADLIVIATHGYTGLKRVMVGSTTERVVRYARCPVLVVPAQE